MARSLFGRLLKPEFMWRPSQVLRRLAFKPSATIQPLPLPWGCTISARSTEIVGKLIATLGLYDLPLTEAIMRLTDAGDTALDIGANIGYTALVFARAAQAEGHVHAFEPNPFVLPTLRRNVSEWGCLRIAPIEVEEVAVSDRDGEAILGFPTDYEQNEGVASLELNRDGIFVSIRKLDSVVISDIGIVKIDVEGHEAAVLSGAARLLRTAAIRDILFEEHGTFPADSHRILLDHGYSIFRVMGTMGGPLLLPGASPAKWPFLPPVYPANFLATVDPSRARARFRARGWQALQSKPRNHSGQRTA